MKIKIKRRVKEQVRRVGIDFGPGTPKVVLDVDRLVSCEVKPQGTKWLVVLTDRRGLKISLIYGTERQALEATAPLRGVR